MELEIRSYDELLKLMFKHRLIMESLLRVIDTLIGIPKPLAQAMDPDTLRPFANEGITSGLSKRQIDSAWIVDIRPECLVNPDGRKRSIIFVNEFQSYQHPAMPVRTGEYSSIMRMDMERAKATPHGEATPVIAIVFYIGERPWRIATDVADLYPVIIGCPPIGELLGSQPHLLVDFCAMKDDDLPSDEPITLLIRQQSATEGWQLWDALKEVYRLIPGPEEQELRELFYEFAKRVPGVPEDFELPTFDQIESMLLQGGNMATTLLEHNMKVWEQKLIDERNAMFAKGEAQERESKRELLRRLAAKRFDVGTAAHVAEHLRTIDEPERLAEVGELIVDCKTAEELFSRLR